MDSAAPSVSTTEANNGGGVATIDIGAFDWSTIDTSPFECPCQTKLADGLCVNDLATYQPYVDWLIRATTALDLHSRFRFVGPSHAGWRLVTDLAQRQTSPLGRVAVSYDSGVSRGTFDSILDRRRQDVVEQLAFAGAFDDLESGAVQLAFETGVQLPTEVERTWLARFWRCEGPRVLRRTIDALRARGSRAAISAALDDRHTMRCLVWLLENRAACFERFLLEIEPICEARHSRALRRAVRGESTFARALLRNRIAAEALVVRAQPLDLLPRVLDAIAHLVEQNRHLLWAGPRSRHHDRTASGRWIGRIDADADVVAIDAEIVRSILSRYGDPSELLEVMYERRLVAAGPSGCVFHGS